MLSYYVIQFLEKLFEFKQQQVEKRKQERLQANQNLGEVLLHMQIKRRGGEFIVKKSCQKLKK